MRSRLCVFIAETVEKMKKFRSYSELIRLHTFEDRFNYLRLFGTVADETFGSFRYLNQAFYTSPEWRAFRDDIIIRDNGMDLALDGYRIFGPITIHHLNPISKDDIVDRADILMDPDQVVCVSSSTHKAIHYGSFDFINPDPIVRRPNDTCPWKGLQ